LLAAHRARLPVRRLETAKTGAGFSSQHPPQSV
jgi:hypothetical protein